MQHHGICLIHSALPFKERGESKALVGRDDKDEFVRREGLTDHLDLAVKSDKDRSSPFHPHANLFAKADVRSGFEPSHQRFLTTYVGQNEGDGRRSHEEERLKH